MEPGEEEGEEDGEEEQRVPPIATTPPRQGWKEESSSRSSSETQASVASGISLGEAIRQKTAVNWEIEPWYQLPAEVDASQLTAASETKLGLTCDRNDLLEFPTLEEGTLSSAEASRRHFPGDTARALLLDIQASRLFPCLPLLIRSTQGQSLLDETLLQQSEMNFILLRGVPDVSGASEERPKPSCIREAASPTGSPSVTPSDSLALSQHPLPLGPGEPRDASWGGGLSRRTSSEKLLGSEEADENCESGADERELILQTRDNLANSASKVTLSKAGRLSQTGAEQTWGASVKGEGFAGDSDVAAADRELLEEEKGLPKHDEFSSSENSWKTALAKYSEKREGEMQKEKVKMAESESEGCMRQLERLEKVPEFRLFNNLSDDVRKDNCKNSDARDDGFSAKASETPKERGVDLNGSESFKLVAVTEGLQGAFLSHQWKQLSPAVRFEREEFIPTVTSTGERAPEATDMEAPSSHREDAPVEAQPGVRSELTVADLSIERGHKVTGISPSFDLVGDGSFSVHLARPSYQSTPGILLKKNVKAEDLGVPVMKSDTQASASCLKEEASGNSSASAPLSAEKQRAQKANKEHFESLKPKYPHTRRIQSLPSLNFMEKVGAWNVSQPEEEPNVVTWCDPGGAFPRRKAYRAISSSSNDILSIQKSSRDPKDYVAASSREAGSLGSLHFHNENSLLARPLTRSQSDNAVAVSRRNTSSVEVIPPANSTEAVEPLKAESDGLGVSENSLGGSLIHRFTAEIGSGSSGEVSESNSAGQSSDPDVSVSSEGVAQLFRADKNSPTDDQKNCDDLENQSHNLNVSAGRVSMDNFSDISPDSLSLPVSSGESSQTCWGSPGCSSVVSRHLTGAKDENFIPVGATALETPVKEELNIEERIPIYLRNLGIDQSPGTILTPFVPRGPIREVEFSPSELRTLKDSTDTLPRTVPQLQGKSLSAAEITETSFNSGTSTLSVSIPMNSRAGSDILSPRELSPCFSRSSGDEPACPRNVSCHELETPAPLSARREAEHSPEPTPQLQPVSPSHREGPALLAKNLQALLAKNESKDAKSSLQSWPAGSLAGVENEVALARRSQTSGVGSKGSKGQESDSCFRSGALQEIHKLLAEVKDLAGVWCDAASSRETAESSPVRIRKEDGPEDSGIVKDNIPLFRKMLSWDEIKTRRSRQEGSVIKPLDCSTASFRWESSSDVSLRNSEEVMREIAKEFGAGKSVGRAEPEGCSSVTADRNPPGFAGLAQSKGSSEGSAGRTSELGNPSSSEPLSSVSDAAGGFRSALSKAGASGSQAGDARERDDSSSGDSLAARVKNLLGNPALSEPLGCVAGGFQSALSKAGAAGSEAGAARDSDDSGSGDSLAACVRNLLRRGSPVVHAAQVPRSSDEEERKSRAWVRLKLASLSQESVSDSNEEDQRRIEEIKAELLLSAKKSALAKDPRVCVVEAASEYSRYQDTDQHTEAIRAEELLESSLRRAVPLFRAGPSDHDLLMDGQLKSLSTAQTPVSNRQRAAATAHSDAVVQLHPLSEEEQDARAVRSAAASDTQTEVRFPAQKRPAVEKCAEDTAKQITSITFSSRKRLRSPLASAALGSGLARDALDGVTPLEVDSASTEEQSCGKQRWEGSKTWPPPPSPMPAGSVSNEVAFTAEKNRFHHVSAGSNGVGAYQETDCLSDEDSVNIPAGKRQSLGAKNSNVLPQNVTEPGRLSARLAGLNCEARIIQETSRFNEPRSTSSYLQGRSSPPAHIQLRESLEGSDPAAGTDLLKGPVKFLEEEKKSPSDEIPLMQKEVAREPIGTSGRSPVDEILSSTPVSPSSPAKKALSCVHITLSSKCNNSGLPSDVNTDNETRLRDRTKVNTQPVSLKIPKTSIEAVSELPAADLIPEDPRSSPFPVLVSSADPCPVLSSVTSAGGQELPPQSSERPQVAAVGSGDCSLKNIFHSVVLAKTGRSTSDAATQITTESPEKTTFSAEIFVNPRDSENAARQSSLQKARELPTSRTFSLNTIAPFPRQGDQPLLLPYKPPGSTSMYYVPCLKVGSSISPVGSEASAESSRSGSSDALPSRFPEKILRLRDDDPPGSRAVQREEGIGAKRAEPKLAWAEEQTLPLGASPEHTDRSKSVKATRSVFRSAQLDLHHPTPVCESYFLPNSELSGGSSAAGHAGPSSTAVTPSWKKAPRQQRVFSVRRKRDGENEFFPLAAEADSSKSEDLNVSAALGDETSRKEPLQRGGREAERRAAPSYPLPQSQTTRLQEKVEKDPPPGQRTCSSGSLDELWMKFLECRRRHQRHDLKSTGELSLVERLDRLARVLQNPVKHTLVLTKPEKNVSENEIKGGERSKLRLPEKSLSESTLEPHATRVEGRARIARDKNNVSELRKNRSGEKIMCHTNRILEHRHRSETPSDASSEARLSRDPSTTMSSAASESDAVTQTELESAPGTEASSSVSTIDTARLIRAFGRERVRVSPRLSQLYWTIDHQKSRSEDRDGGGGEAGAVGYPEVTSERHGKREEIQIAISRSLDSTSASSSSWGPSPALSKKRRTRMLNKGVQAGDLEIVSSATKKNTRDVGVTFPTPRPCQPNQRPQEPWHHVGGVLGQSDGTVTDHQAAGSKGKQKGQPGDFFVEKRTKRNRLHLPQGISWFVQAEDLKSESRKENHSNPFAGAGPSWFEPLTSAKPWREPLREKNWQEQQQSDGTQPAVPARDAQNGSSRPFVKLTLQEALAVHRPDFISRSGERVKHLKLVMEERRIQSVLQSEREELFNPPEKRKGCRNANHVLAERGFRIGEKRRAIPKSEMVQRSKRIYEQLPEVQKKREEEKRKMEYSSYRLKAQLYKTKITNRVLGRKVPWN